MDRARRTPRVAVVGGGIGGLAVAIALRRRGAEVVVHEQARRVTTQGAGIAIGANGHRALRALSVAEALAPEASEPLRADFRHWRTGTTMVTHRLAGWYPQRFGAPFWTVERAALHRVLLAELGERHLRLGARCERVEQGERGAVVHFADGTAAEADAVVGADGIHSAVRDQLLGPQEAVFSGTCGYRALVPMDRLRHVPQLAEPVLWLWLGPGRHFIAYPVADGSAVNFLAVVPDHEWTEESWYTEGLATDLLPAFEGWHPFVVEVLAAAERPGRWALYDREPLRRWSRGRVTLLGDAAHAMLPHHGQGANQCLEDAVVLGALLGDARPDGVAEALRAYEQLRRPRTRLIQSGSRKNAECFQLPDGPRAEERNRRLAGLPDQLAWIHGHDVVEELRELGGPGGPDGLRAARHGTAPI